MVSPRLEAWERWLAGSAALGLYRYHALRRLLSPFLPRARPPHKQTSPPPPSPPPSRPSPRPLALLAAADSSIPQAKAWGARYASTPSAASTPLLDLSQGVPGEPPHPSVLAAVAREAGDPEAAKYGPILGEPAMREALAGELRELYGLKEGELVAEDVGITTGCNMAFLVLLM